MPGGGTAGGDGGRQHQGGRIVLRLKEAAITDQGGKCARVRAIGHDRKGAAQAGNEIVEQVHLQETSQRDRTRNLHPAILSAGDQTADANGKDGAASRRECSVECHEAAADVHRAGIDKARADRRGAAAPRLAHRARVAEQLGANPTPGIIHDLVVLDLEQSPGQIIDRSVVAARGVEDLHIAAPTPYHRPRVGHRCVKIF